jgi:uncharacterized protein (DUF342 family)
MVWDRPQYFSLKVTKSSMSAFIPKGSPIHANVKDLSYKDFLNFLLSQYGIVLEPPPEVLENLKAAQRYNPYGLKQNFELVSGTEPVPGRPGALKHLNPNSVPQDLVVAGVPFLRYQPPVPSVDGCDVHGERLPAPHLSDQLKQLILPPEMELDDDGNVMSSASGQARVDKNQVHLTALYRVDDPTEPLFQSFEFPCSVWIDGDLAGAMKWRVCGDLTVDGHLSAPHIEVLGNLSVKLGIQTNHEGIIRVSGNVKTGYLQMSRMGIMGNLDVDRGILQCDLRVKGHVKCMGVPGSIQGSRLFTLSSIQANRAGSDAGISTELSMPYINQTKPIRIGVIADGTKLNFKSKSWTTAGTSTFSAQSQEK